MDTIPEKHRAAVESVIAKLLAKRERMDASSKRANNNKMEKNHEINLCKFTS